MSTRTEVTAETITDEQIRQLARDGGLEIAAHAVAAQRIPVGRKERQARYRAREWLAAVWNARHGGG